MKKLYYLFPIAVFLVTQQAIAGYMRYIPHGDDGAYANIMFGVGVTPDLEFEDVLDSSNYLTYRSKLGTSAEAALGYKYQRWHLDASVNYMKNLVKSVWDNTGIYNFPNGYSWGTAFMANVLYDVRVEGRFQPNVGVGAGVIRVQSVIATESDARMVLNARTAPAMQATIGFGYRYLPTVIARMQYQHYTVLRQRDGFITVDRDEYTTNVSRARYANNVFKVGLTFLIQ